VPSRPDARAELLHARLVELDALLEHRSRLAICVLLSKTEQLSFSRLKQLLQETDGNLGAQLRKLEDAGYLSAHKEFVARRPVTWYRLTPAGRKALLAHLAALARVIAHATE
jgi:DNA-binding PadR family transcriptional regulator